MKKVLALALAAMMVISLAACATTAAPAAPAAAEPKAEAAAPAAAAEPAAAEPKAEAAAPAAAEPKAEAAAPAADETFSFAFTCTTTDNEYFSNVASGCKQFCDEKGIEFVFEGCEFDAAKQYEQFENYITKGVDAIICCPADEKSLYDVVEDAKSKGIAVIGQAQAIPNANGNSIVDDYDYGVNLGKAACEWINKNLADEENVEVCLITLDAVEQTKLRGDGMQDTIESTCPNAKVVFRQKGESAEEAMDVLETALTANPNIKVVACVNDNAAIGAEQAAEAYFTDGIPADFYIGGADYTSAIVPYLEDPNTGVRCSVDIQPVQSGIDCCQMAYDILTGAGEGETKYFSFAPIWKDGAM